MSDTQYFPLNVTDTQRKNLETLYAHLGTVDEIDMNDFARLDGLTISLRDLDLHNCGTVNCLAGNGPRAGVKPQRGEDWPSYVHRVFGARPFGWPDATVFTNRIWDWLFDADWKAVDNTAAGGRARIRMALDFGIPANFREQLHGDEPISYSAMIVPAAPMSQTIHFNTGRLYQLGGQRITATLHDDGIVTFHDHSRMVDGSFQLPLHCSFDQTEVMHWYDAGQANLDRQRSWADAFMVGGCNSTFVA